MSTDLANSTPLPTDDEYLNSLVAELPKSGGSTIPAEDRVDPDYKELATKKLMQLGHNRAQAEDIVRDALYSKSHRGVKIETVRQEALSFLSEDQNRAMSTIPVGLLQTQRLNACAVSTPRGGAVILLDGGVVLHMIGLARAILALCTYNSAEPYCRDHEPIAWVDTILCLAHHAVTGNRQSLQRITTWNCPSLPALDLQSAKYGTLVEVFTLLHEYGHIVMGHLNTHKVYEAPISETKTAVIYSKEHQQELDADRFAFDRFISGSKALSRNDAAYFAGTLFRFFDLCEHMVNKQNARSGESHPAAIERWNHIRALADIKDDSPVLVLDSLFDMIISVLPNWRKT